MRKKRQYVMRGIAVLLAVVVAATTVLHNNEMLLARETFSGLQTMLANNQQLTIVEIVDDFEESSMGYLIGGAEPYDVAAAQREGTMDELIDDLLSKGLLTTGNTDDWNSYPLRYEVTDTVYSDYAGDEKLLNEGFRRQEESEEAATVSGYYEMIPENADDEVAFYRLNASQYSYDKIMTMSPAGLQQVAESLYNSYAPEGYQTTQSGWLYFRFVAGNPSDAAAAQVQNGAVRSASEGTGAGAVTGIEVTSGALQEGAAFSEAPRQEDVSGGTSQTDGSNPSSADAEQPESEGISSTNEVQPGSGDPSSVNEVQQDNAEQSVSESAALPNETRQNDGGEADAFNEAQPKDENTESDHAVSDSASAVIYVELDENNSVLVASLGNAGVEDVLDGTSNSVDGHNDLTVLTQSGSSAEGISNGGITVTPAAGVSAPTPVSTPAASSNGGTDDVSGTHSGDIAPLPSDHTTAPDKDNTPVPDQDSNRDDADDGEAGRPDDTADDEDMDGSDENEEPSDSDDDIEDADGSEEDRESYTITYGWTGLGNEGESLKEDIDGRNIHTLMNPAEWTDTVEDGTAYFVRSDYEKGKKLYLFDGDTLIGIYTFSGWHKESSDEILTEIAEVTGNTKLVGEWVYTQYDVETSRKVFYQWILTEVQEGTLPSGVTRIDDIVLKSQIQTFDMSSAETVAACPKEEFAESGEIYTVNEDYAAGDTYDAYDANGNLIGICTFQGWKVNNAGDAVQEIEITQDEDINLVGEWLFYAVRSDKIVSIQYNWVLSEDGSNPFAALREADGRWSFSPGTTLPNGVVLAQRGDFDQKPELPQGVDHFSTGIPYRLDTLWSSGAKIRLYEGDELVGTYTFSGWTQVQVGDGERKELTSGMLADGFDTLTQDMEGDITISGEWTYEHAANIGVIAGTGRAYAYIKDGIHNNDWFRYYVMGLEKENFGNVNIQLVTYLADGSDKRMYGYGPCGQDCTLTEALNKADLVYLNTDGVDAEGNMAASHMRFSSENAKALLERACNVDRSLRLAVILDNSVRSNSVDDNIKKVRTILLQSDISEAYQSLGESDISYDTAFTAEGWQILAAKADEAIKNNGNFVRDNIYCVSDRRTEFRNTTYSEDMLSYINKEKLPALANADFENRFTDSVTDAGFAEVYQAIQKENYERARNGGQASIDEYVMPAMAVAYILNYRDYDPIIYKDKIRVLELEPCRDYTYYYDEKDHPTPEGEMERKKQFAIDWAPDFLDKLEEDPDAITIDGMTTSEFCGKILDIYEEYDVIYIGSNNGILHQQSDGGGLRWTPVSAYNGTVSRRKQYDDKTLYTYHNGNWYESKAVSDQKQEVLLPNGPDVIVTQWGSTNWRWDPSTRKWLKDETYSGNFLETDDTPGWDIREGDYRYDSATHQWFENRYDFGEEVLLPNGIGEEFFLDGTNENDSTWRWRTAGGEWISGEYVTHDAGWYHKVYAEPVTYTAYTDTNMDGMLYTHVGDKMSNAYGSYYGHLVNEDAYGFRSSGNDILSTQVDELIDYLNGGSLIILSSEFMTQDENGNYVVNSSDITRPTSRGAAHGILDTSSYVYQFVRGCFERKADGSDVPRYSNLIVEDYGNGDLRDTEAFIEALNQQKVTLNLYAMPTPYGYEECTVTETEGTVINSYTGEEVNYSRVYATEINRIDEDTRSMLQKEADGKYYLNYEFIIGNLSAVAPLTTRYHVQLFLDSNSDGIYNTASEELGDITVINAQTGAVVEREGGRYQLQMNVPYRVRRELPDGYVGCIGWKLMVTQNGNEHIHDSVTGLTAVAVQPGYSNEVNPATGKKIIHVLQITPNLYGNQMDLELQTDLSNAWSGNGNFDEEWYELLTNLPDFEIDFDSIYYWDFAHSYLQPGEAGYDAQYDNGGVDGKLTGAYGRSDYLNLYQYDMVIVGFCDMVPSIPSQRAVEALLRYADMGKSMLFTHDTTYSGWENGSPSNFTYAGGLGQSFSMSIRDLCGMDRYGVSVDWYRYDGETAQDNREGSPIRTPSAQASAYNESSAAYQWYASHPGGNSRDVAYAPGTDQTMMAAQTQGLTWGLTGQAYLNMFDWQSHGKITAPRGNRDTIDPEDTNTVTQVNGGIITQYPYDIPLQIEVGDTHAQYYQLDLDTDWDGDGRGDVVCWYAISSLDNGDWNDIYDFSPNDVRNNYYIYNKGNITYTGVGHSTDHITLDEKKLFINTFVAAYSAGIRNPSVRIVEDGSVNAPDLENVSIPFNGVDEATAGTYRVYYQVKDNNITQGTRNLSVKYYIGNPAGSDTVTYRTSTGSETISADLFADEALTTYSADTGLPVGYDEVRSGYSYYVDVPLNRLLDNEKFDFYVEVDLTMADDPSSIAAFDVDKLTITKLKMFSLD